MERPQICAFLVDCEFFKELGEDYIGRIAELCAVETFEPGDYIFRQGDFGKNVYVITGGQVYLERSIDLGSRTGSAVIGVLGKGGVLGCWSSLLGEPHTLMSSAACRRPTTVLAIDGPELRNLLVSERTLGFLVLERLCFLLRDRIQAAYGAMEKI